MSKKDGGNKDGQIVLEKEPKTKKPSLYRVIMLNDDYTPMNLWCMYYSAFV